MARKSNAANSGSTLEKLGLQKFEMESIHRSKLTGAPYNPRVMGLAEKRKLRDALKKHGLVAPITWNKRTGNIVGGHQRIDALDTLAGTADYSLDVAVIDVDDVHEKELNILLNNDEAMGDFDLDKLGILLKTPDLDLTGAGFDSADIMRIYGEQSALHPGVVQTDGLSDELDKMREVFENTARLRTDVNFFLIWVFRTAADVDAFVEKYQLPDNRYQSAEHLQTLMKPPPAPTADASTASASQQPVPLDTAKAAAVP